jgi:MarR family transcriptional regulator for hemolysin
VRLEVTEASLPVLGLLEDASQWLDEEATRLLTPSEVSELKRLLEKLQAGLSQALSQSPEGEEPRD